MKKFFNIRLLINEERSDSEQTPGVARSPFHLATTVPRLRDS
jgi:hypothetical protein